MKQTRKVTKRRAGRAPAAAPAAAPVAAQAAAGKARGPVAGQAAGRIAKVSELKAGLSAYLARVKAGEEVVVTDRGTPVARLVPVGSPVGQLAEWASVRALEAQGRVVVRGDGRVPRGFSEMAAPVLPEGSVVRALLADREEGP
jgi:prevent-host-death family protein